MLTEVNGSNVLTGYASMDRLAVRRISDLSKAAIYQRRVGAIAIPPPVLKILSAVETTLAGQVEGQHEKT